MDIRWFVSGRDLQDRVTFHFRFVEMSKVQVFFSSHFEVAISLHNKLQTSLTPQNVDKDTLCPEVNFKRGLKVAFQWIFVDLSLDAISGTA